MEKQFIQIGNDIFNRSDIIRVSIAKTWDNKREVVLCTRELDGCEVASSSSKCHAYKFGSEEATALLSWLEPQIEVLVPYREDPPVDEEEDI